MIEIGETYLNHIKFTVSVLSSKAEERMKVNLGDEESRSARGVNALFTGVA